MKNLLITALIGLNAFLIFTVAKSIKTEAEQIKRIANRENAIKEKLSFIRDLQQVHKSQKGYYAPTWADLETFASNDQIYIITRGESNELEAITKIENTIFTIDTLRSISVMDSIFSQSIYTPNTLNQIPGEESNLSFKLLTDTITLQGVEIEVMEISCPVDVNPKEKPDKLKIGSLESASLAGNWN